MMKAAVVEKRGKLVVRDVPEPTIGDYECLCETLYGSTCSGTDVHLIEGHALPFEYDYPLMLGHESIGRVLKVGVKVENFREGDIVTRVVNHPADGLNSFWGGFAERSVIADHEAIKKTGAEIGFSDGIHQAIPETIDPAEATMIITWRETFSFINRIGVESGDAVLVLGSGGNGLSFANHARNLGARAVCIAGSPNRRYAGRAVGADSYVSYQEDDLAQAAQNAGAGPFDLIIDSVGKAGQLDRVLGLLKPGGKMSIYGMDDIGKVRLTPTLAPGSFTYENRAYNEGEAHQPVVEFMQQGKLRASDYLDLENVYPLNEITRAIDAVRSRKAIKAVVKLSN
jgi:2-desacetyl-2-hydroxyethyl bacteriochlorophyllide A dehydrogenase